MPVKLVKVVDVDNGAPIPGVTLSAAGIPAMQSDAGGLLPVVPVPGVKYTFTHTSYQPEELDGANVSETVYMTKSYGDLPNIVITAIKKKENIFILLLILFVVAYLFYLKGNK